MSSPFDSPSSSIPVTVVTRPGAYALAEPGATLLRLDPAIHEHAPGAECVACAARGDIRAILFDLLQSARAGQKALTAVVVDASGLADAKPTIDRLERGIIPAFGLRDHTVARSFHLKRVI